jgi:hypothetical protein
MLTTLLVVSLVLCAWAETTPATASSQQDVTKKQGYINFPTKELFGDTKSKVEVMLEKPMLQMLKAAAAEQEPEFAKLMDAIEMVRVQVFENVSDEKNEIAGKISDLVSNLKEKEGWSTIIRVKENRETVDIIMKVVEYKVKGFGLIVQEPGEIVFINIVGDIDAEAFGQSIGQVCGKFLSGQMDMDDFGKLLGGAMNQPQSGPGLVVSGVVKDAATGKPIEGAKVSDDKYGSEPYKSATTDTEGKYSYKTWPEEHNIIAQAPGYKPQQKMLKTDMLQKDKETVIVFELERE